MNDHTSPLSRGVVSETPFSMGASTPSSTTVDGSTYRGLSRATLYKRVGIDHLLVYFMMMVIFNRIKLMKQSNKQEYHTRNPNSTYNIKHIMSSNSYLIYIYI